MYRDSFYYTTEVEVEVPVDEMISHLESTGYEVMNKSHLNDLTKVRGRYRGSTSQIVTQKLVEVINNCEDEGNQDVFKGVITSYLNVPFSTDKETICKLLNSKL